MLRCLCAAWAQRSLVEVVDCVGFDPNHGLRKKVYGSRLKHRVGTNTSFAVQHMRVWGVDSTLSLPENLTLQDLPAQFRT